MEKFRVGESVEWKSQAGGVTKKKRGIVSAVVPAGDAASVDGGERDFSIEFDLPAKPREAESYLVRVKDVRKGRNGMYWPPAGKLTRTASAGLPVALRTSEASPREKTLLLPSMPERSPLAVACDNYLEQAAVIKEHKKKLDLMGGGILSAMQKEKRNKLSLSSSEGETFFFEVLPTGYHLKVTRAKA